MCTNGEKWFIIINYNVVGGLQVDDKYQYSSESKDNNVHGWISSNPPVGFWIITPSNEFRTAGPTKQDLTSHAGPIALSVSYKLIYIQLGPFRKRHIFYFLINFFLNFPIK